MVPSRKGPLFSAVSKTSLIIIKFFKIKLNRLQIQNLHKSTVSSQHFNNSVLFPLYTFF